MENKGVRYADLLKAFASANTIIFNFQLFTFNSVGLFVCYILTILFYYILRRLKSPFPK